MIGYRSSLGVAHIDLLAYHAIGVEKYNRLGMSYPLKEVKPPSSEQMEIIAHEFEQMGFAVRVGG
jgi:pyruvate formate lyase activating enzyme